MKSKLIIIGVVAVVVAVAAVVFIARPGVKKAAKQPAQAAGKLTAAKPSGPVQKPLSKDMGGLIVKIMNIDNKDAYLKLRVFRAEDSRRGIYTASFVSNTLQELLPGTYDIEIETTPQTIYKDIKVALGKVTVEDLGHVGGAIVVRSLDDKKKEIRYAVRVLKPKTGTLLTASFTNRPIEVADGTYDVEIGTLPRQLKRDVNVEKGKRAELEVEYASGILSVTAADAAKKAAKTMFRVKRSDSGEMVAAGSTPNRVELLKGSYVVEIIANPPQVKKDVIVNTGSETAVEFLVQSAPVVKKAVAPIKKIVR